MNPSDYLSNPQTKRYDADLGDWLDPDEVVVPEGDCALPTRRANPAHNADLASVRRSVDQALNQFGIRSGTVDVGFTPGGSRRAGFCAYNRRTGEARIRINRTAYEAFSPEERLNTTLHEAAHAIQYLKYAYSDHGPEWVAIARSVGCTGDRCLSIEASHKMYEAVAKKKGQVYVRPPPAPGGTREMFKTGDTVSFPTRSGTTVTGKITKRSPVRAEIMAGTFLYKVTYNYLTLLRGAEVSDGLLDFVHGIVERGTRPTAPPVPDRYFQTAVLVNGSYLSSQIIFASFEAARATLSDFVTDTERSTGQRVAEVWISVSEAGNTQLRTVKTFKRKA